MIADDVEMENSDMIHESEPDIHDLEFGEDDNYDDDIENVDEDDFFSISGSSDDKPSVREINGHSSSDSERDKSSKHLKKRYWDSYEEFSLIEIWKRYMHELFSAGENSLFFRKISWGMKDRGIQVTGQECKRQINTLCNRYYSEKRRINAITNEYAREQEKSKWRLYNLIDLVLNTRHINLDEENPVIHDSLIEMSRKNFQCKLEDTSKPCIIQGEYNTRNQSFMMKINAKRLAALRRRNKELEAQLRENKLHYELEKKQMKSLINTYSTCCRLLHQRENLTITDRSIYLSNVLLEFPFNY